MLRVLTLEIVLQVLSLPVLPLPAPVSADSSGSHLQLRGHPDELPGLCSNSPAANQSGSEEAVQRASQSAGRWSFFLLAAVCGCCLLKMTRLTGY